MQNHPEFYLLNIEFPILRILFVALPTSGFLLHTRLHTYAISGDYEQKETLRKTRVYYLYPRGIIVGKVVGRDSRGRYHRHRVVVHIKQKRLELHTHLIAIN